MVTVINKSVVVPYDLQLLFDIVIDVEKYPNFLPWCDNTLILSRNENKKLVAELVVRFMNIKQSYISDILYDIEKNNAYIHITSHDNIFEYMITEWNFSSLAHMKTKVSIEIRYKISSKILSGLMDYMKDRACEDIMNCFLKRAKEISQ